MSASLCALCLSASGSFVKGAVHISTTETGALGFDVPPLCTQKAERPSVVNPDMCTPVWLRYGLGIPVSSTRYSCSHPSTPCSADAKTCLPRRKAETAEAQRRLRRRTAHSHLRARSFQQVAGRTQACWSSL